MMPPTYVTCLEVGQYADPDDGAAAAATGRDLDDVHAAGGGSATRRLSVPRIGCTVSCEVRGG